MVEKVRLSSTDPKKRKCYFCRAWKNKGTFSFDGHCFSCWYNRGLNNVETRSCCACSKMMNFVHDGEKSRKCSDCKRKVAKSKVGLPRPGARDFNIKRKYGLTSDDYSMLLNEQNGMCRICSEPPEEGKVLHVDHCHKSGRIRGLLCLCCNTALGKFKDSPEVLERARDYVINSVTDTNVEGMPVISRVVPAYLSMAI